MYKDYRYINAGENEFYKWGKQAQEYVKSAMQPNENGYYSIMADGGKYWTIGTSEGKFGKFAKFGETILPVNNGGYVYAKAGTDKGEIFIEMLNTMLNCMIKKSKETANNKNDEDEKKVETSSFMKGLLLLKSLKDNNYLL